MGGGHSGGDGAAHGRARYGAYRGRGRALVAAGRPAVHPGGHDRVVGAACDRASARPRAECTGGGAGGADAGVVGPGRPACRGGGDGGQRHAAGPGALAVAVHGAGGVQPRTDRRTDRCGANRPVRLGGRRGGDRGAGATAADAQGQSRCAACCRSGPHLAGRRQPALARAGARGLRADGALHPGGARPDVGCGAGATRGVSVCAAGGRVAAAYRFRRCFGAGAGAPECGGEPGRFRPRAVGDAPMAAGDAVAFRPHRTGGYGGGAGRHSPAVRLGAHDRRGPAAGHRSHALDLAVVAAAGRATGTGHAAQQPPPYRRSGAGLRRGARRARPRRRPAAGHVLARLGGVRCGLGGGHRGAVVAAGAASGRCAVAQRGRAAGGAAGAGSGRRCAAIDAAALGAGSGLGRGAARRRRVGLAALRSAGTAGARSLHFPSAAPRCLNLAQDGLYPNHQRSRLCRFRRGLRRDADHGRSGAARQAAAPGRLGHLHFRPCSAGRGPRASGRAESGADRAHQSPA